MGRVLRELGRARLAVAVVVVVLALAAGLAACGDSDDDSAGGGGGAVAAQDGGDGGDGDGAGGGAGGSSADAGGSAGGAEEQVRAAVVGVQEAFRGGRASAVCALLSEEARRVAGERANGGKGGSCREGIDEQIATLVKGSPLPKIVSIEVDGDRGLVKMREDKYRHELPVVREGGEWKVEFGVELPSGGSKPGERKAS